MRLGYQISVDIDAHRANLQRRGPHEPVIWLIEVMPGDVEGVKRRVHQVKCTGPSWTEYGWGPEREHARGTRFGASVWVFTEHPVEYLDEAYVWYLSP